MYDTEQAEKIANHCPNSDRGDFYYLDETLYKTDSGNYFLHGEGGAATSWATPVNGGTTSGEGLKAMTSEEALDWCEKHEIDGEILMDEFSDLIEPA